MTEQAVRPFALFAGDRWSFSGYLESHYRGTFDAVDQAIAALPTPQEVESGWGCAYALVLDLRSGETVAWLGATYGPPGESQWNDGQP